MSVPVDLRVLSRRLASTPVGDLPALSPVLVAHVVRCGVSLSAPLEQKSKEGVNESSMLVNKLRTQINTLLNGKTPQGRFVAVVLIKAVIDVGGWECLRASGPWVRGLLSILQKPDPIASKELAIVTLTKIYSLLHDYQTLVREIATPTVGTFVTASLQIIKPSGTDRLPSVSLQVVETVVSALLTIVPLFPTTLRPFATQIRAVVRVYIAPTSSDKAIIPSSLRMVSRQLAISLHQTAPKNGIAEEWQKYVASTIRECHSTSDQIFRAVQESWESSSGYEQKEISFDEDPQGGGDGAEELPPWIGLQHGGERLTGLLELLAQFYRCPTKSPVAVPLATFSDLLMRISLVLPPAAGVHERDSSIQLNPSVSREEREELWSTLPDIYLATFQSLLAIIGRLNTQTLAQAPEMLELTTRIFKASRSDTRIRESGYVVVRELLQLIGPTLSRVAVDPLDTIIQACCHDILGAAGYLETEKIQHSPGQNGAKSKPAATANADLFLASKANTSSSTSRISLSPSHQQAAEALLEALISHLPQQHLKKAERALLDRTAILSGVKDAMLASVLHPYLDKSGRYFANTLPFLSRRYPHDADVEILRTNIRSKPYYFGDVLSLSAKDDGLESLNPDEVALGASGEASSFWGGNTTDGTKATTGFGGFGSISKDDVEMGEATAENESEQLPEVEEQPEPVVEAMTLKRKSADIEVEATASKRVDVGKAPEPTSASLEPRKDDDGEDSDSDGSVHLEMVLDDDEDEDED